LIALTLLFRPTARLNPDIRLQADRALTLSGNVHLIISIIPVVKHLTVHIVPGDALELLRLIGREMRVCVTKSVRTNIEKARMSKL
jgi:hypothetical protein